MATAVHRGDAGDLARRLGERIQSLAPELLPRGHRQARWWRVGSLAGEEGQSLAVALWGARQGRWHDYSAGIGGDGLDLVNGVLFHSEDIKQAMDWARASTVRKLELHVFPHNEGAIALYESMGFEREGYRTGHYRRGAGFQDAILMALWV